MSEETNHLRKVMEIARDAQRLIDEVMTAAKQARESIDRVNEALETAVQTQHLDLDPALTSASGAVRLNNKLKEKTEKMAARVGLMREVLKLAADTQGSEADTNGED